MVSVILVGQIDGFRKLIEENYLFHIACVILGLVCGSVLAYSKHQARKFPNWLALAIAYVCFGIVFQAGFATNNNYAVIQTIILAEMVGALAHMLYFFIHHDGINIWLLLTYQSLF